MKVTGIDHVVLTVRDLERTINFYTNILGMTVSAFGKGRLALKCGSQKINLHEAGEEFAPHAGLPTPGSADLCFLTDQPLSDWLVHLAEQEVPVVEGPARRTGALGPMMSIYVRDPDRNLVEISRYGE
jgi:catechol 2,3-dioxygenase-like lactoylglutathione lyase family enzyme